MFKSLTSMIGELLFPVSCKGCRRPVSGGRTGLCDECWKSIRLLHGPCCPRCGKPFASLTALAYSPNHQCGGCRETPPYFDRAVSVAVYENALAEAIHLFKYSKKAHWSKPFGALLLMRIQDCYPVDLILPVPLHPRRLRQREYNQSLLLSHELCQATRIPLEADNLRRIRHTQPQIDLKPEDRYRNVRRAFQVVRPEKIHDRRILLVDDVYTTGSTVNECARTLKKAGAKAVNVLTLARMI